MRSLFYRFQLVCIALLLGCSPNAQQPANQQSHTQELHISQSEPARKPGMIVLGWNAFGTTSTYIEQGSIAWNMNVVSPRWFTLNKDNLVAGEVDPSYVEWAHKAGKQVWAFFGNKFDADLTDDIISNKKNQIEIANKLKNALVDNQVDGLNIDFENIKEKNRDDYVGFVATIKRALAPHNIVVTVDVTRTNPDPVWSGSFDRRGLGKVADYIVMMGYDEDLGGGGKVGSVASLPWVEEGVQLLIKDVPAKKVILATPFYTREWVTDPTTNGTNKFDRTMVEMEQIIKEKGLQKKWDDRAKQNYVEYMEKGLKHQMWVEDEVSMKQRLGLVDKYGLKGVAVWAVGLEKPSIWSVFGLPN
ncbi:hypothetical protein EDM56_27450 [Brevibacillus fluminis]|uniref:GH18 domain-containing protein n=1 Tax=Brevibacillus fluminis TaxID=511487 RepID=A0A3M8CXI1_9BACL|nr:glycosyl hydrolase family 18 protein [Brevibacillus fluminis]RNB80149.1 hypothetical protein EDM56_27450 [Brevibacillus fluminis]